MKSPIKKENRAAYNYAKELTAHYSKSFYISSMMLPKQKRWATFALYGFCRYVDNIIDKPRGREKEALEQELSCFRCELEMAFYTEGSEHPAIGPFVEVAKTFAIPIEYPLDLIRGVQMDIQHNRYNNFDDLYLFAYRVASVVGLMMTHILGYKSNEAFFYAEKLGIALQLTNILRDIQEDKNNDRIYLPQQEMLKFNVAENDMFDENFSDELKQLMIFQVNRAYDYYESALPGISLLSTDSQFAIYSASQIYRGILSQIEARDFNPFLGRVFVPQRKKILVLVQQYLKTQILQLKENFHVSV